MRGVWAGAFVIALLAACGKFGKDDGDTTAETDDGGTASMGTSSSSGSSGTSGAPALDAGSDAHVDAGHAVVDCDAAAFCDLFDRDDVKGPWAKLELNGDTAELFTGETRQGSGAVHFIVRAGSDDLHVDLKKDLDRKGAGSLTFAFSFRAPKAFGPDDDAHVNLLAVVFSDTAQAVVVAGNGTVGLTASTDGDIFVTPDKILFVPDVWNDAVMTVKIAGKTLTAALDVNGATAKGATITDDGSVPDHFNLTIGPSFSNEDAAFAIDFDTVRVDIE